MRSIKAIFKKQMKDMFRNRVVLVQFAVFPIMALVMTELVAKASSDLPDTYFVTMFAAMFTGMSILTTMSAILAEDIERKSLRCLVMAGVKPHEYLAGVGGVVMLFGLLVCIAFGVMGKYSGWGFLRFVSVLALGSIASIILGAAIGILSKNQQAATAMSMPIAMVLAFSPMIAAFNDGYSKAASILYTLQIDAVANGLSESSANPFLVICANIALFAVVFAFAYKKKGLKG